MRKFSITVTGMLLLLSVVFSLTSFNRAIAQSCNQVEILYSEPDCFKTKPGQGTGSTDLRGCKQIAACVDQPYVYTSSMIGGGFTYLWAATGPSAITINPNNTSPQVNIVWPVVGTYTLTISVTTPGGTFTNCVTVNVSNKPAAGFTFTPNNVCAGSTISFTNTTTFPGGGIIYSWNFSDPASGANNYSTATNPTHIFNAPGVYNVMLIASSFSITLDTVQGRPDTLVTSCCSDTFTLPVTILPGTLAIECISTVCAGDTVKYSAVGCANTTWLPPVGGTIISSTPTTVTIVWGNGAIQGQILAMCPGGCTVSVTVPIIPLNPQPTGNLIPCDNTTTSYTLPLLPGSFYTWSLLNTTNGNNYTPVLYTLPENNTVWINWALLPPGVYQLTVNINNKHICCNRTGTITITPKGRFQIFTSQTLCVNGTANLTTSGPGSFNWVTAPATGVSPSSVTGPVTYNPSFSSPGIFTVTATETAGNYCVNTQQLTITVVATPPPAVINGPVAVCNNSTVAYGMGTPAPAGFHYTWSITGGAGSFQPGNILPTTTGNNVTILWTTVPGMISVVLEKNSLPLCTSPAVTLAVNPATTGTVSGNQNVCVDGTETYILTGGNLPPGEPVNWVISPANHGTITSGQGTGSVTVLWHGQPGAGPWTGVSITAVSNCGGAIPLTGITIYPKFTFTLTQTSDICQPGGAVLSALGAPPGATYLWSNTATTPTISVLSPGFYTLTITNPGGCTYTKTIEVKDPFIVGPVTCGIGFCVASGATNQMLGVVVIKPVVGPFTYQWYSGVFPGGSIISGQNSPNYTAPADGPYYCLVTYGTCTRHVDFNVAKVCCPDINNPQITNVVQNNCFTYTFTGTTPNPTGASVIWDFGDGITAPGTSGVPISHTYVHAGTYCVKFCVGPPATNPTNCTGNCSQPVNVTVPIEAIFIPTLSCNGCLAVQNNSVIISPQSFISYLWNFGDGNTSTLANPPPNCYAAGGTYTVTLTITYNNGVLPPCTSTATSIINYTPLSILVNPTPVCTNSPVSFTSNPLGFITYNWSFGDGFNAFTGATTHIYTTPATGVPVSLTVVDITGTTCVAKDTIDVLQGSSCTIAPAYICPGSIATILGPAGGIGYLWQVFNGSIWVPAPGVNNTINYNTTIPGQYHVLVTIANGCICTSNHVLVPAVSAPDAVIAIAPTKKLCGPGLLSLTSVNHLPGYTSNWYNGNLGNPIGSGQTVFTFVSSNTNIILILINQYGCSDTCSIPVEVNAPTTTPIISSNPGGPLCAGQPIILTVTNYPNNNNTSWNTGALGNTITVYNAGTYTATFTSPVTGCSSSKSITVNARPSTDLFPHYCDSIPCDCIRPFAIYAPLPLVGPSPTLYNIQWWNANTNTQILTGITPGGLIYNNLPNGVQTGSYYLVMTDPATGCSDTSNNYSIVVPPCDTCDCKDSKWGDILLTGQQPLPGSNQVMANIIIQPIKIKCDSVYALTCNNTYTLNAGYICKDSSCPGTVTYTLVPPAGPAVTGSAPVVFTPTVPGTYTLFLYGYCGGKICDTCKVTFVVTCPVACECKGSTWGETIMTTGTPQTSTVLACNQQYTVSCNVPITINSFYNCLGNACAGSVKYTLTNPLGGIINGNAPFTFTPNITGNYTLMLYGYCGTQLCDSCKIIFKVSCVPLCDCNGSHWGDMYMIGGVPQAATLLACNQQYDLPCRIPVFINASYICAGTNCPDSVRYKLTTPLGATTTGNVPFSFIPSVPGTYTLMLYGYCGTKLCDSCKITFKVSCVPNCNCNGSKWGTIWASGGHQGVSNVLKCGKNYNLPCNVPVTINANYLCNGNNCPGSVKYAFTTPAGVTTTGNVAFTFIPVQSGIYTLWLYGYCGTTKCDSCKITFKVTCAPLCKCEGSQWEFINMKSGAPPVTKAIRCDSQYVIPCNVPVTINALYLCSPANCNTAVGYKLTTPAGATTTGNLALTFNPTQSGTYTLTLYGYCGNKICDSCVIRFKVDCCNCSQSQWGVITMRSPNGPPKQLVCNSQYAVPCNVPILINATYLCAPSTCRDTVTYKLTTPAGVTTTGNVAFVFNPTQSGIYTLVLYGYCGSKICDSCVVKFKVDCCNCTQSQWEYISMKSGTPPVTKQLYCNQQYTIPCNVPLTINALYLCSNQACIDTVTYALTTPAGVTTTGNLGLTFNPTQSGTYTLKLYGYCGDKICDSCVIRFKVDCCNCTQSQWEHISMKSGTPPVTKQLYCNQQYTIPCNVPVTINALYLCSNQACIDTVTYALTTPAGVTTTGNLGLTFNPTQSGTYTLKLYGYCGNKICDSCVIRFKVDCCNCSQSQWGVITMRSPNGPPKKLLCNTQYAVPCNVPILINATYLCAPSTCRDTVTYTLTTPAGVTTTGNVAFAFNPTQSGIYTLVLYGYCGSKICDSCVVTFKVDCCNCTQSQWEYISMKSGTPPVTKQLYCNQQYTIPCNVPVTINALYLCSNQACVDTVTYALTTPAGVTTTGNLGLTFNPTQSGTYTLKLYGYCGDKICDSCVIRFKVDCCNCSQSQWGVITMRSPNGPPKQLLCNTQYAVPCNVPILINATYLCAPSTCRDTVTYTLTTPAGVTTTGNVAFPFNPTQSGIYTLVLYGYCGSKICDSCVVTFKVDCCNCTQSQWEYISMKSGTPPVTKQLYCNQQYTIPCNVPVTINALYLCSNQACIDTVTYALNTPAGVTTTGNLGLTFNPTQSGTYTLKLYGYCGDKICDSCVIRFKVDCPLPCNCTNSRWGVIRLNNGNPAITRQLVCNTGYSLPCNIPVTLNASYLCNSTACPGTVKYTLTTPAGTITTGTAPITFTPIQNGIYILKLEGYCGTQLCATCSFSFIVNCGNITMVSQKRFLKK